MPYLADLINPEKKIMNVKKGAQVCLTTTMYVDDVHACKFQKYDNNIMYMMPTVKAVEKLCKVMFDPIFSCNPWLNKLVSTNTASIKTINSRSIVFVGAQAKKVGGSNIKDSDNLRSIPCDRIDRDEIDLMDPDMVYMSKQRLRRSRFAHERNFGSPTFPGYGIDDLYENSDQGKWQIRCGHCNKDTCLVESFPRSIQKINGVWTRVCVYCGKEIFVIDGRWIHEYPDRREAGFWVDGLLGAYTDLEEVMYQFHNVDGARLSEFMRSTLGIATTEADNQLSTQDVYKCCSGNIMQMYSTPETVMGVDVNGTTLHVTIGIRTGRDLYEILNMSRCKDFGEVHDLAKKMNVKFAVIDALPETHAVREFAKAEPYAVYMNYYSEAMPGKPNWNRDSGVVKCNRNEWCDKVHEVFVKEKIKIPRQTPEVEEYAREMTKTAKMTIEHPETGIPKPKWIKLSGGDDHYYHSTLYFLLAGQRAVISSRGTATKRYATQKCEYSL
jgi:hypothetical protein